MGRLRIEGISCPERFEKIIRENEVLITKLFEKVAGVSIFDIQIEKFYNKGISE